MRLFPRAVGGRLLAAAALGLGLAAAPVSVAPTAAVAAPSTDYVALGDSYSSGTGTDAYDLSATCERSSRAYPAPPSSGTRSAAAPRG